MTPNDKALDEIKKLANDAYALAGRYKKEEMMISYHHENGKAEGLRLAEDILKSMITNIKEENHG